MFNTLGYNQPIFILPFDHRTSFLKKLYGAKDYQPTVEETKNIASLKQIIFEGFKKVVDTHIPREHAAILVDKQFGDSIIREALASGYNACVAVEKSGQNEFDFEYGEEFGKHIDDYKPRIVKALIRYNPDDDIEMNKRQGIKLKKLSDFCHSRDYKLLIEPLMPATNEQLESVNHDEKRYDNEIRPELMIRMVQELQQGGVEPDIWKIEGLESSSDYRIIVKQMRSEGRDNVGAIVLGRGADPKQVEIWLKAGSGIEGVIGFAVGRTTFWQSLVDHMDGIKTKEQAAIEISERYYHFYKIFTGRI